MKMKYNIYKNWSKTMAKKSVLTFKVVQQYFQYVGF